MERNMNVRLIILLIVAAGMAVYFAVGKNKEPVVVEVDAVSDPDDGDATPKVDTRTISDFPLPGREPADAPEAPDDFGVTVEVDQSGDKNRLYLNITEKHGYYVETFRITAWYKKPGVTGPEDSPLIVPIYLNQYLKANETLRTCIEVVPAELRYVGGDIGKSENWEARVDHYDRVREKNPEKFPTVVNVTSCDKN